MRKYVIAGVAVLAAAAAAASIYTSTIGVAVRFSFSVPDEAAPAGYARPGAGKEFTVNWQAHLEPVKGHRGQWQSRFAYIRANNSVFYTAAPVANWADAVVMMQVHLVNMPNGAVLWCHVFHVKAVDGPAAGGNAAVYTSGGWASPGAVLAYHAGPLQPGTVATDTNFSACQATVTLVSPSQYQPTAGCVVTDGLAAPEQ